MKSKRNKHINPPSKRFMEWVEKEKTKQNIYSKCVLTTVQENYYLLIESNKKIDNFAQAYVSGVRNNIQNKVCEEVYKDHTLCDLQYVHQQYVGISKKDLGKILRNKYNTTVLIVDVQDIVLDFSKLKHNTFYYLTSYGLQEKTNGELFKNLDSESILTNDDECNNYSRSGSTQKGGRMTKYFFSGF